jgi:hypothetical protein
VAGFPPDSFEEFRMFLTGIVFSTLLAAVQDDYKFSEFESWNRHEAGASVTLEGEAGGYKFTATTTLKSKDKDVLKVETKTKVSGMEMDIPAQEREIKNEEAKCPACGKGAHGTFKKSGKEKVKIGDKEIEVTVIDFTSSDCEGKENGKGKMKVSDEVPGGLVSLESEAGGQKIKMVCSAYSKGGK